MTPLVSVAVPVYNGANYMREAIDSVLAQTYPNVEIVVVNDGSTDDGKTEEVALTYGDRIRYFAKPNGGVATALNMALEKAQGDYFCWLSHDDIYLPEKVEKEMDLLLSLPDPNAVVFCRYSTINDKGKAVSTPPPPPKFPSHRAAYQLILGQWLHCCTILAPKALYLDSGSFRADLPTTQDYDLLVKIGLRYPFIELPEVLLKARAHAEQGSLTLGHRQEVERFFEEHVPLLSPEYMQAHFTSSESIDAFVALGQQMRDQGFVKALLLVAKQLTFCEAQRANPEALWAGLQQLMIRDYMSIASQVNQFKPDPLGMKDQVKTVAKQWLPFKVRQSVRSLQSKLQSGQSENTLVSSAPAVSAKAASLDFAQIYEHNGFEGTDSLSGEGSTLFQTRVVRAELPKLIAELGVQTLLDVPCGDWHWMREVNLDGVKYIGGDIVQAIVDKNNEQYGDETHQFKPLNIVSGPLPQADMIFCRDCLVHLSFADGLAALEQFRNSGAKWLLTTTFTDRDSNKDLYEGDIWRPLNLERPPYNLPKAQRYINEGCTEGNSLFSDKCLALWKLS